MNQAVPRHLIALLSGVIFGFGLGIAQMTNPEKIKDFLDILSIPSGGWDPSLAFVMGGGLLVAFFGLRADRRLRKPLAAQAFSPVPRARIDTPLIVGAATFGIGWGISGLCPGPAIADIGLVTESAAIFVAAMLAGSWLTGEVLSAGSPLAEAAE